MTKQTTGSAPQKKIALCNMVDYERVIPVELKLPHTGEGTGVIIRLHSGWSEAVKTASRKAAVKGIFAGIDDMEERQIKSETFALARLAGAIDSWDLGDKYHLFEGQDNNVECNDENKLKLVSVNWIFMQLHQKYEAIENFMNA